ncbi:transporter substrate-binding domain-containing protein [Magnetococcus sp. PR-3]|uniref:transporter substrate-binding domain-containing protein n=1 Tax=Magnetococcus sp. PR-3 TaxID=3120355 RepID=UPI002FCE658F
MKRSVLLISLLLGLLFSLSTHAAPTGQAPLRVLSANYPPFSFLDAAGKPVGITVDFWQLWSRKMGRSIDFQILPWPQVLEHIQTGRGDIISGLFYTEERADYLDFTSTIWDLSTHHFYQAGAQLPEDKQQQAHWRIGVVDKEHSNQLARRTYPHAQYIQFQSYPAIVQAAVAGKIDSFFSERMVGERLIHQHGGVGRLVRDKRPISLNAMRSAVVKGHKQRLQLVEQGLVKITKPEVEAIFKRWSPGRTQPITLLTANMPPMIYVEGGEVTGLGVEIVREITRRMGVALPITLQAWRQSYQTTLKQPGHVLLPPSRTEAREKLFKWVGPVIPEQLFLFSLEGRGVKARTVEQAKALKVGAVQGYASYRHLERLGFKSLVDFPTPDKGLQALFAGEIDLWINSNITIAHTAQLAGLDPGRLQAVVAVKDLPAYLAFHKHTSNQTIEQWQQTLDAMKEDGTFNRLLEAWVPGLGLDRHTTTRLNDHGMSLTPLQQTWLQQNPIWRIGVSPDMAPLFQYNERGEPTGPALEILRAITQALPGVEYQVVQGRNRDHLLKLMKVGEIDLILALDPSVERLKVARFVAPYTQENRVMVARSDAPFVVDLQELQGQTVAVALGSTPMSQDRFQLGRYLKRFATPKEGLQAVSHGEVDLYIGYLGEVAYWIRQQGLLNLKLAGRLEDAPSALGFAVRADWPMLEQVLNQGLHHIGPAQVAAMIRRWQVAHYQPEPRLRDYWKPALAVVAPVLCILLLFIFWNRRLRREIAERYRVEQALKAAKEQAVQASQAKSEFMAVMSHEIRTPMNVLLGMVELVLEQAKDPQQKHYLGVATASGQALLTLLNDMLDLSRIESGEFELQQAPFQLRELIEQIHHIFTLSAADKGLGLRVHCPDTMPAWIMGDKNRLRQILVNLTSNAIKFTEQGHVVIVAQVKGQDALQLTVTDSGIGIPQEKLTTIFDPFTQADAGISRQYGGVGLGLYISSRLIQKMAGYLDVSSTVGQGSIFTLELPLVQTQAPQMRDDHAQGTKSLNPKAGRSILLVEDGEDNRLLIRAYLKKSSHTLTMANDGEQGVHAFQSGHFDVVLMDVQMPGLDGYGATRAIRHWESEQGRRPTPIYALSAHAFADAQHHSMEAGCNGHLTKPISKVELLDFLKQLS